MSFETGSGLSITSLYSVFAAAVILPLFSWFAWSFVKTWYLYLENKASITNVYFGFFKALTLVAVSTAIIFMT